MTEEVLPTIRKTGGYSTRVPKSLSSALFLAAEQQQKIEEQEALIARTRQLLESTASLLRVIQPKAQYCDEVLQAENLVSIGQIAKDFGKTAKWLNNFLASKGIQFRMSGMWQLYKEYADKGLASSVTARGRGRGENNAYMHTKWTQKGRAFIASLLKQEGIYPIPTREQKDSYQALLSDDDINNL